MIQKEDRDRIFNIVSELTSLAFDNKWELFGRQYPIIITGGETAILNTIKGFDVGIMGVGYVAKGHEIRKELHKGDFIIGLGSSGCHSNGYTFLREEFFAKRRMHLDDRLPWGETVGDELTKPTEIYLHAINWLLHRNVNGLIDAGSTAHSEIHGMVNITGGGLSKLTELNPEARALDIVIRNDHLLGPQNIFRYVKEEFGVPTEKMYTRFNNGVGYVVAVDRNYVDEALVLLRKFSNVDVIGEVVKGKGRVVIKSAYDAETVVFLRD
jgi:phosphoribosylformylglycinamidine cyclo-ligase